MALKITKNTNINGQSIIEGIVVETYTANINQENPEGMTIVRSILNNAVRKEHRAECIEDEDGNKVQEHLYAKTLFIGDNDSIENYIEIDENSI